MTERKGLSDLAKRGIAFYNKGDYKNAAKRFEEAVRGGDDDARTRRFLAHSYASMGRTDEAVRQLREAFRLGGDPSGVFDALRMIMGQAVRFGEAEESLKLAAERAPDSGEMRLILGGLYFEQGRLEDAEAQLRKAVRIEKSAEQARLLLGRVLESRGRVDEAETTYREAARTAPQSTDARLRLGEFLLQRGRWEEAEAALREAVSLDEGLTQGQLLLGRALEARGLGDDAEDCYKTAARLKPRSPEPSLRLGEFCMHQGRMEEAIKHLGEAMRKDAATSKPCLLLAELHSGRGALEAAAETLRDGALKWPEDAEIFFRAGWIHRELGRTDKMRASFRQYLRLEKKRKAAERFLACVAVGDFTGAAAEGEAALDEREVLLSDRFFHPWVDDWFPPRPAGFYEEQLAEVEAWAARDGGGYAVPSAYNRFGDGARGEQPRAAWAGYFKGLLYGYLGRERRSLSEFDRVAAEGGARYGWMRYAAGLRRLFMRRFAEAKADFAAAAACRPDLWIANCHLAEAELCLGDTAAAFAAFDAAEKVGDAKAVSDVRAWRGEALLWIGRYEDAAAECGRAILGGSEFARTWRGAARMLSGDLRGAQEDLDRAAASGARDAEIYLWRGELKRRRGDRRGALEDLDQALAYGGGAWARLNKALALHEAGRVDEFWTELEALPEHVFDFEEGEGLRGLTSESAAGKLERALAAARGVRRTEAYGAALWLNFQGRKTEEKKANGRRNAKR